MDSPHTPPRPRGLFALALVLTLVNLVALAVTLPLLAGAAPEAAAQDPAVPVAGEPGMIVVPVAGATRSPTVWVFDTEPGQEHLAVYEYGPKGLQLHALRDIAWDMVAPGGELAGNPTVQEVREQAEKAGRTPR